MVASACPTSRGPSAEELFQQAQGLHQQGRLDQAIGLYGLVIAGTPDRAEAYYKRANALNSLGRLEAALEDYDRAISLNPAYVYAWCNRGSVLERLERREEALASYDRALALDSKDSLTYYNRGSVLKDLKRFEEALASYDAAIALNENFAEAYVNRGNVLQEQRRHEEAVASFGRAIELKPVFPEAYQGRGISLYALKRFKKAQDDHDKAIEIDPAGKYLPGMRLQTKIYACRWDGLDQDLDLVTEGIRAGKPVCVPLTLAAVLDRPALQRSVAEIWVRDQILGGLDKKVDLGPIIGGLPGRSPEFPAKIRIGYFSADFWMHPVACLTAGMFERHDRSKFEVTAFAFGPERSDAMVARLAKAFDRFVNVRQKSDLEVAALARELNIDIAIDVSGLTEHCRTKIFALRAAPIQINFLGYPGTMGAPFMDYLIADGTVIPRAQQAHYMEKVVYLPNSFMPFDSSYAISDRTFTREELGLPSTAFVFCCFNNNNKITPEVFDRWMRIMKRVEGSVLWLSQANATAAGNLRTEAERRGVAGARLIFAERMVSSSEHLARLRAADLFLDTFPYNAHATAMDALWAGVPLLTLAGESFASRVAASLLRTAGLGEFIASSPAEYEEKALGAVLSPGGLGEARRKLAERATPLFDTDRYTRDLEAAYEAIFERHQSGLPPAHLHEELAE